MIASMNLDRIACYDCGEPVTPGPRDRGVKRSMRYLIAYDVCEPRRLRQVAKICEDYGVRVQKSVFECDLEPDQFVRMWEELCDQIVSDEDYLVGYSLCRACAQKVESAGIMVRPEKVLAYIA